MYCEENLNFHRFVTTRSPISIKLNFIFIPCLDFIYSSFPSDFTTEESNPYDMDQVFFFWFFVTTGYHSENNNYAIVKTKRFFLIPWKFKFFYSTSSGKNRTREPHVICEEHSNYVFKPTVFVITQPASWQRTVVHANTTLPLNEWDPLTGACDGWLVRQYDTAMPASPCALYGQCSW